MAALDKTVCKSASMTCVDRLYGKKATGLNRRELEGVQ